MNTKQKIDSFFQGKSVAIVGFGREGKSTLDILKNSGCKKIAVLDRNKVDNENEYDCVFHCGENYLDFMKDYDIIVKSPGIALLDSVGDNIKEKITSQTDLFLRFCENKIIGITGTKGKSTTSSLIAHILNQCGIKSVLIGNIGIPPLSVINDLDKDTVVVCEMSCHQLEYVKASPSTSLLLNIYEEHLDHYVDFNAYKTAKENIYRYQKKGDLLIYNKELEGSLNDSLSFEKISVSQAPPADVYLDKNDIIFFDKRIPFETISPKLEGRHNLYNIAAAITAAVRNGCDIDKAVRAVSSFNGLEHRMETVKTVNGVKYINDSISTIPLAAINAVKTFNADTLIIGGMDRGIDYKILTDFLNSGIVENIICLPDSGYRIAETLNTKSNVFKVKDMEEAVQKASAVTKKCCVLSPAAASYGFYKNFEERGKHFKELVNRL